MGLVNEYTTVGLNSSVISYYENLGYKIPRSIDNQGRLRIPRGTTIDVKTTDLMPSSNQVVDVECDFCKKHKKLSYIKYNKNINNNNGFYLCSIDENHRNFVNGGYSDPKVHPFRFIRAPFSGNIEQCIPVQRAPLIWLNDP